MKASEVSVGKFYWAKVGVNLTTVRLDAIRDTQAGKRYDVTNMATSRETTFRSAAKFQCNAQDPSIRVEVQTAKKEVQMPKSLLAAKLTSKLAPAITATAPHLIIKARAGTGKTTVLVEGLRELRGDFKPCPNCNTTGTDSYGHECQHFINGYKCRSGYLRLKPSPQQQAVWDSISLSKEATSIGFVAFNKSIAEELKSRVPAGIDAMTMHSLGNSALRAAFGQLKMNEYRVSDIISELTGKDIRDLRLKKPELVKWVQELVSLCKMNLIGLETHADPVFWTMGLSDLASYYDIELNGCRAEAFDLVPRVLERCKDVQRDNSIDFSDMIWLPVVLNLTVKRYDLLLIDESQDLNRCQQALAKRSGKRLVFCGDEKQAIYGFSGADSQSLKRLEQELSSTEQTCQILPLTVTRRCGKAIVEEAKKYVPDFEAHESNSEGKISTALYKSEDGKPTYREQVQDGDMVICRCNAPLVSQCFKFLRRGRKATIQGRDVGQGLISTVNKVMKGYDETSDNQIAELHQKLSDWLHTEETKENAKRNPSESRLLALQDRYDCLICFTEGAKTVKDVTDKIESIFTNNKAERGIRMSSVHRAKGLESNRVFILQCKGAAMPLAWKDQADWEYEQELNILYVAVTRSIQELIYVSGGED